MPRYYFIVQRPGQKIDDDDGAVLQNDDATLACAQRIIEELKDEADCDGSSMTVKDAPDRIVSFIPF